MEKVVILGRVSTDQQNYERQVVELTEYCCKVGWKVVETFTNKISGAETIENKTEIKNYNLETLHPDGSVNPITTVTVWAEKWTQVWKYTSAGIPSECKS